MGNDSQNNSETRRGDEYTDFEYMDHDIHISGRISKQAKSITSFIMAISAGLAVIGLIILSCFASGSTTGTIGVILLLTGGMGVLFIAPIVGSFFE